MTSEKSRAGWYFLSIAIATYIITAILSPAAAIDSISYAWTIIKKIFPVFLLVFAILIIFNYAVRPKSIAKHLGKESGAKGWMWSIIGGIISTGPIYLWYPLLNEIQKSGARNAFTAVFLYNRAVKPALLPLFIFYFGTTFTITLVVVMIIMSIAQGYAVEKIVEAGKR